MLVHTFETQEAATVGIPSSTYALNKKLPANVTVGDVLTRWRQKYRACPEVEMECAGEIVESARSLASLAQGSRKPLCFVVVPATE